MAIIAWKMLTIIIVALFNDLLSRFSKARNIKWPSFLQTKGFALIYKDEKLKMKM